MKKGLEMASTIKNHMLGNLFPLMLLALATTLNSQAAIQKEALAIPYLIAKDVCALDYSFNGNSSALVVTNQKEISTINQLSPLMLSYVNKHILDQGYTQVPMNLRKIQSLFSDSGEQRYNDLEVISYRSTVTGYSYVEVKSYPGDNPYSHIYSLSHNRLVSFNQDGSIAVPLKNKKMTSCDQL